MKCVKLPDREKCTIKKMVTAEKQASRSKTTCHVLQLSNSLTEFRGFCRQGLSLFVGFNYSGVVAFWDQLPIWWSVG